MQLSHRHGTSCGCLFENFCDFVPTQMISDTETKNRQAQYKSLIKQGDTAVENGKYSEAETCFYGALELCPGITAVLTKIGHLYKAQNREEDATLCFRGVIPDAANAQFFDSNVHYRRTISQSAASSCITHSAYPPENTKLKQPTQHGVTTQYPNFRFTETDSRGSFTTCIKLGRIWFDGFNTVAFDQQGHVIQEHTKGNEYLVRQALAGRKPIKLDGRVCFLDARSSPIYYHWMLDVLPKLQILQRSGIELDSIDQFIVRASSGFQRDTLAYFGIPAEKIRDLDSDSLYSADELILPFLKNDCGDKVFFGLGLGLASWIPAYLQQIIPTDTLASVKSGSSLPVKRIFISRQDSQTRCIENATQVNEVFDKYGIETVNLGDLSVAEQASLMYNAELVIGVHGAGFTNLAFCQQGTRVLELFGSYIVPCYWSLANLANLDYHNFMCDETISKVAHDVKIRRDKNILVDIAQLETTLAILIEPSAEQTTSIEMQAALAS